MAVFGRPYSKLILADIDLSIKKICHTIKLKAHKSTQSLWAFWSCSLFNGAFWPCGPFGTWPMLSRIKMEGLGHLDGSSQPIKPTSLIFKTMVT